MARHLALPAALAVASLALTALGAPANAVVDEGELPFVSSVVLRADANRDGVVDLTGTTDATTAPATASAGALFLPNLDDDAGRCADTDTRCSDATDDVVNGPDDARDLARIKSAPLPNLPATAVAKVTLDAASANRVRLFVRDADTWRVVTPDTTFNAQHLAAGLEFGLEGTDIVRDTKTWNGVTTVSLLVDSLGYRQGASVSLRVAPVLFQHNGQATERIIAAPEAYVEGTEEFSADLEKANTIAGNSQPVLNMPDREDRWVQDWMDPTYVSMPVADGQATMRLLLRSDQTREAHDTLYTLRGKDVGVVRLSEKPDGGRTRNGFGNLEVIPPHTANGVHYPVGRVVLGYGTLSGPVVSPFDKDASPVFRNMLAAQGTQPEIRVDTRPWFIGHTDEFVQFQPADNEHGFVVTVADPQATLALFRELAANGHGDVPAGTRGRSKNFTINTILGDGTLNEVAEEATAVIEKNLQIIKEETGITEAEIMRVPGMYMRFRDSWGLRSDGAVERHRVLAVAGPDDRTELLAAMQDATSVSGGVGDKLVAFYPQAVNYQTMSAGHVAIPKQWGPVIDGVDVLTDAVRKAFATQGITVTEVEDYEAYHSWGGEVHCGTNAIRATDAQWW